MAGFGISLCALNATARDRAVGSEKEHKAADDSNHYFPPTAWDYAKLVEPQLGVPPKVDLGKAVELPMYIDGEQVHGVYAHCDNSSRLGKGCVSGSVVQRYEGKTRDGEPLPDVVWVAFGRNAQGLGAGLLGSVQMIGYDTVTGATAFFESSDAIEPWAYLDEETQRLKGVMPWVDDPEEFNRAYRTPGTVQCVGCHQNDPFIHNSFMDAAKIPGTDEPVVPVVSTRDRDMEFDLPYYVIGGENWDMRTIHIGGNGCLGCHRIGMSTLLMFMRTGWDPHEWMPPNKPGSLVSDFEELMACWRNTPEKTPGCDWVTPPTETELGRVVGDYAL